MSPPLNGNLNSDWEVSMRLEINGELLDTQSATSVVRHHMSYRGGKPAAEYEELFLTEHGTWFLHCFHDMSEDDRIAYPDIPDQELEVVDPLEALYWLVRGEHLKEIAQYFPDLLELCERLIEEEKESIGSLAPIGAFCQMAETYLERKRRLGGGAQASGGDQEGQPKVLR